MMPWGRWRKRMMRQRYESEKRGLVRTGRNVGVGQIWRLWCVHLWRFVRRRERRRLWIVVRRF